MVPSTLEVYAKPAFVIALHVWNKTNNFPSQLIGWGEIRVEAAVALPESAHAVLAGVEDFTVGISTEFAGRSSALCARELYQGQGKVQNQALLASLASIAGVAKWQTHGT